MSTKRKHKLEEEVESTPNSPLEPIAEDSDVESDKKKKKKSKKARLELVEAPPPAVTLIMAPEAPLVPSNASIVPLMDTYQPKVHIIDDGKLDEKDLELPYVQKQRKLMEIALPLMRKDIVKVKDPDLAVLLWSVWTGANIHCLELNKPEKLILSRDDRNGKAYINFKIKRQQRFPGVELPKNKFFMLSCFFAPAFFKWGSTEETGLNGTLGKLIKDNPTQPGHEQYQVTATNKPIHPQIIDEDDNNPVATAMMTAWDKTCMAILEKVVSKPEAIPEIRKIMAQKIKAGVLKKDAVDTDAKMAEWIKSDNLFKQILKNDEDDPSTKLLGMAVSCYRPPKCKWVMNRKVITEDTDAYVPPSDMFKRNMVNVKTGELQLYNDLPLFRCRRADEIEPGKKYDSPFILVSKSTTIAALDTKCAIGVIFQMGFYEFLFDKAGITNKQAAYVYLNKLDDIAAMNLADVEPVNPLYGVPMAGEYHAPEAPKELYAASGADGASMIASSDFVSK